MTIDTGKIRIFRVDVEETMAFGIELFELRTAALGKNGMAGVAIGGWNHAFGRGGFVHAIMTTKTAGPILVANVVRIGTPVGLHLGKEIVAIHILGLFDELKADWRSYPN